MKARTGEMQVSDGVDAIFGRATIRPGLAETNIVDGNPALAVGARCRLNELGRQRSPKLAAKTGTILRQPRNKRQYYVLWDGNVTAVALHCTYIELVSGDDHFRRKRPQKPINADTRDLSKAG